MAVAVEPGRPSHQDNSSDTALGLAGLPPAERLATRDTPEAAGQALGTAGLGVPTQACMTLVLPNLCPPAAATGNPHLSIALTCWPVAMGTGV